MEKNMKTVLVDAKDLPISCPNKKSPVWNVHPRVFIPLHETPKYTCPYCSTQYQLIEEESKK